LVCAAGQIGPSVDVGSGPDLARTQRVDDRPVFWPRRARPPPTAPCQHRKPKLVAVGRGQRVADGEPPAEDPRSIIVGTLASRDVRGLWRRRRPIRPNRRARDPGPLSESASEGVAATARKREVRVAPQGVDRVRVGTAPIRNWPARNSRPTSFSRPATTNRPPPPPPARIFLADVFHASTSTATQERYDPERPSSPVPERTSPLLSAAGQQRVQATSRPRQQRADRRRAPPPSLCPVSPTYPRHPGRRRIHRHLTDRLNGVPVLCISTPCPSAADHLARAGAPAVRCRSRCWPTIVVNGADIPGLRRARPRKRVRAATPPTPPSTGNQLNLRTPRAGAEPFYRVQHRVGRCCSANNPNCARHGRSSLGQKMPSPQGLSASVPPAVRSPRTDVPPRARRQSTPRELPSTRPRRAESAWWHAGMMPLGRPRVAAAPNVSPRRPSSSIGGRRRRNQK